MRLIIVGPERTFVGVLNAGNVSSICRKSNKWASRFYDHFLAAGLVIRNQFPIVTVN
jgi:hypothetical protein